MPDETRPLTEEEMLIRDGIANPLSEEDVVNLLAKSIIHMRASALKRGDQKVLRNLQDGDPYEIARQIFARGRKENDNA